MQGPRISGVLPPLRWGDGNSLGSKHGKQLLRSEIPDSQQRFSVRQVTRVTCIQFFEPTNTSHKPGIRKQSCTHMLQVQ